MHGPCAGPPGCDVCLGNVGFRDWEELDLRTKLLDDGPVKAMAETRSVVSRLCRAIFASSRQLLSEPSNPGRL